MFECIFMVHVGVSSVLRSVIGRSQNIASSLFRLSHPRYEVTTEHLFFVAKVVIFAAFLPRWFHPEGLYPLPLSASSVSSISSTANPPLAAPQTRPMLRCSVLNQSRILDAAAAALEKEPTNGLVVLFNQAKSGLRRNPSGNSH